MTERKYKPQDNFHEAFGQDEVPQWRDRLRDHLSRGGTPRPQDQDDQEQAIGRSDIAMEHPENKSALRVRDDGRIELFVSDETGILLDPTTDTIAFIAKHIYQVSTTNHTRTAPDGFLWNRHAFNAELYDGSDSTSTVFHSQEQSERHSPSLQNLLADLPWGHPDA